MSKQSAAFYMVVGLCVAAIAWGLWNYFPPGIQQHKPVFGHYQYSSLEFDLKDPQTAPEDIRSQVMLGFNIMFETRKYAPGYAGDKIDCTNCHFAAGDTLGGKNNGIPLVGVTHMYPRVLENGQIQTLAERTNACFEKSINGKPVPIDGELMQALLAYYEWISQDVKQLETIPWLGLEPLTVHHQPNLASGERIYANQCADCHGKDGEGLPLKADLSIPPVWGKHSFNRAAGMNKLSTLSAFIYANMPYDNIGLTQEEAIDVAGYIISKPRP